MSNFKFKFKVDIFFMLDFIEDLIPFYYTRFIEFVQITIFFINLFSDLPQVTGLENLFLITERRHGFKGDLLFINPLGNRSLRNKLCN